MSADYDAMWQELGLDLELHAGLLGALGQGYEQTFLGQKNRPEAMKYFDFVMSEVHGLRIKELMDARAEGRKVVGSFCVFVPEELVLAVDAISVGLCAGAAFGTEEAEQYLPRNTCALIKAAFGFAITKVCPYVAASDLIVGELTCDGKKKSYELFPELELVNDFHTMDLPQIKNERGKDLLRSEYRAFARRLEELTGRRLEVGALAKAIATVNAKRRAMHELARLRAADPAPISGLDALLANQIYFYDDPERFTASVGKVCEELVQRIETRRGVAPAGAPRFVVSGCPMSAPNWKLHSVIENAGAVVVGEESCVGERGTQILTDDRGSTVDALIDNIVDRYFQIDCAVFTPNPSRVEHVEKMVESYRADGVIHYALQFCQPYQVESGPMAKALERKGIPFLALETDYSTEDAEQLRTRIEAFIEQTRA